MHNRYQPAPKWLDEITGEQALDWVSQQNERTLTQLNTPRARQIEQTLKTILEDDSRLTTVRERGDYLYNFWTDADHPRGLWRRTTWDSYPDSPHWEVLLDIDQLGCDEGESWVFAGAQLLPGDWDRALISLSVGGSDTSVVREFDIPSKTWVSGGFELPASKGFLDWIDRDTVWASWGATEDEWTHSGYPRVVRRWSRGEELADLPPLFTGQPEDVLVAAEHESLGHHDLIAQMVDFQSTRYFLVRDEEHVTLSVPLQCDVAIQKGSACITLREEWQPDQECFKAGTVLIASLEELCGSDPHPEVVFVPDSHTSVESVSWTRHNLVINISQDAVGRALLARRPDSSSSAPWQITELQGEAGRYDSVVAGPRNPFNSDDLWLTVTGFLQPPHLDLLQVDSDGAVTQVRRCDTQPAYFDAEALGLSVEQHFVTSADGTEIPYFMVGKPGTSGPCLLSGYGGFQISMTPSYLSTTGSAWLTRGGRFVLANIRGGGEYGPAWHQAALQDRRHRAYEDFAAVAQDLVDRGYTTPAQLACQGGSNGGLLVGNMLVGYPELFGAVVCLVPLLDMRRYHTLLAGNSWMAEYGNPDDPAQWEFIRTFSPFHRYQDLRLERSSSGKTPSGNEEMAPVSVAPKLPPVFFVTSTRDDRVHPAHARTMAWQILQDGGQVSYFENTEGGHAGSADAKQRAFMQSLQWEFLLQRLSPSL